MRQIIYITLCIIIQFATSCTVTNNVYLNDAMPLGNNEIEIYAGAGTGVQPAIDSVDTDGNVFYTGEFKAAPLLFLGGEYGVTERANIRYSMHLPYGAGGFGIRGGGQYSLLMKESRSNVALGGDLGFTLSKDSLNILGSEQLLDKETNGSISGNVFMTFTYAFQPGYRLNLTTRYQFSSLFIRDNIYIDETTVFSSHFPSVSLGFRLNKFYLESTLHFYQNFIMPQFGVAFVFSPQPEEYYMD